MWTNANKRLHPPLLGFFTPPFAIPLETQQDQNWPHLNPKDPSVLRCCGARIHCINFCYRRSLSLSVLLSCLLALEKQALLSALRSVLPLP